MSLVLSREMDLSDDRMPGTTDNQILRTMQPGFIKSPDITHDFKFMQLQRNAKIFGCLYET